MSAKVASWLAAILALLGVEYRPHFGSAEHNDHTPHSEPWPSTRSAVVREILPPPPDPPDADAWDFFADYDYHDDTMLIASA